MQSIRTFAQPRKLAMTLDKRINTKQADAVNVAIRIYRLWGGVNVSNHLRSHDVPQEVIERILQHGPRRCDYELPVILRFGPRLPAWRKMTASAAGA